MIARGQLPDSQAAALDRVLATGKLSPGDVAQFVHRNVALFFRVFTAHRINTRALACADFLERYTWADAHEPIFQQIVDRFIDADFTRDSFPFLLQVRARF